MGGRELEDEELEHGDELSVRELITRLNAAGVSTSGIVDKDELVKLYQTFDAQAQRAAAQAEQPEAKPSPTADGAKSPRAEKRRLPLRIQRHMRLPVWPAWQGVVLGVLSLLGQQGRNAADKLESAFGGRVCPMGFEAAETDPFIMLVHHRHAFRPFDLLRPLFAKTIVPEGFPAHPHRGFETVTYVLPDRGGLVHRDSLGCKLRYGSGACQWMTAGSGLLHEEMWDVWGAKQDRAERRAGQLAPTEQRRFGASGAEFELYQLWLNLPPKSKMSQPKVQLLTPPEGSTAVLEREGGVDVRNATLPVHQLLGGNVTVRVLAAGRNDAAEALRLARAKRDGVATAPPSAKIGAETHTPLFIAQVTLRGVGTTHSLSIPSGWTCIVYARLGPIGFDGVESAPEHTARTFEMAYLARSGTLSLTRLAHEAAAMVFAGEPIGAPVAAAGTMVMNSPEEVEQANADFQRGTFGIPWDHRLGDAQWAEECLRQQRAGIGPRPSAGKVTVLEDDGCDVEFRRRLDAGAEGTDTAWLDEWQHRFHCWFQRSPARERLSQCVTALNLQLETRFGELFGTRAVSSLTGDSNVLDAATAEAGCEWVSNLQMPEFPPLPRLVPWGVRKWQELDEKTPPGSHQQQSSGRVDLSRGLYAGIAAGASFGLGTLIALGVGRRRRVEFRPHGPGGCALNAATNNA